MKSRVFLFLVTTLFVTSTYSFAATKCSLLLGGELSPDFIQGLAQKTDKDLRAPANQKLAQVAQKSGIQKATINQDVLDDHNTSYTNSLERGKSTDQKSSGRCWIFAGCTAQVNQLIAEGKVPRDFSLSQNHLHVFNMLEKSNRYLEYVIALSAKDVPDKEFRRRIALTSDNLGDGGQYEWFQYLVKKYGLVPSQLLKETKASVKTADLLRELQGTLGIYTQEILDATHSMKIKDGKYSEADLEKLRKIKEEGMEKVWRTLTITLGRPKLPNETFTYQGKSYTPITFATEFIGYDPENYVVVRSEPLKKFRRTYQAPDSSIGAPEENKDDSYNVRYLNLPIYRMRRLTEKSIDLGYPVYFGADIHKDVYKKQRILNPDLFDHSKMPFGDEEPPRELNRREEVFLSLTGSNHAMVFTRYDKPDRKKTTVKYGVENSWGFPSSWHMYPKWFDKNVFKIAIPKSALSPAELKIYMAHKDLVDGDE